MVISALKRIFIIDDDPDIRQMLSFLLRSSGFEVVGQAGDGVDVLGKLKEGKPGVVLLDINLPGVNGLDVLEEILKAYPHLKVIMISGSSSNQDVQNSISRGAVGYIVKPFNTKQVIQNIERAMALAIKEKKSKSAG